MNTPMNLQFWIHLTKNLYMNIWYMFLSVGTPTSYLYHKEQLPLNQLYFHNRL